MIAACGNSDAIRYISAGGSNSVYCVRIYSEQANDFNENKVKTENNTRRKKNK